MSLVQYVTVLSKTKRSDTTRLQAMFPSQPALDRYDDAAVTAQMELLHNGVIIGGDFPNQSLDYAGINATTRPFVAADVKTGASGLPWTAFSPNIVSPGPGSLNPSDIAAPPPGSPRATGAGSQNLPGTTTPLVSSQEKGPGTPGNLVKGHSATPPIT